MRRQFTIGANVDREGRLCGDVKVVQPGLLGSPVDATASMTTTPSSAREFALRLTSPVSAVLSAFAGPFGGAVLAGPFSRRSALPGDGQVDLQFSRKTREEAACGYSSICTQGLLQLSGQSLTQMSTWRLDADWSLRDLDISGGPGRYPSMQLQMEKLRSLKTSLKYSATHLAELFDAGLLNAKAALELAGPPGDVSFLRGELVVKAGMLLGSTTLGPLNGHVSMGCGLLLPAGRSCPQDRFHLGGASGLSALKGFAEHGAEPRSGRCAQRSEEPKERTRSKHGGRGVFTRPWRGGHAQSRSQSYRTSRT
ncbi:unnamed protein product [Durusdinium trenchii]|uniref:AsmA-like C-terminal domain-containing protein n=1 Tax=Durusdinium trenchii TaxID=1381693 RepID=A0ABP0QKS5_9DINO